jgi:hypothetical protein
MVGFPKDASDSCESGDLGSFFSTSYKAKTTSSACAPENKKEGHPPEITHFPAITPPQSKKTKQTILKKLAFVGMIPPEFFIFNL